MPIDLDLDREGAAESLIELNLTLLIRLQSGGKAYLFNAVIQGNFALRACIVSFRTSLQDIEALLPIVLSKGRALDLEMRPHSPQAAAE